jgi:GntR family transcriptional regulator, transcriptional repressor for pyruvate dehydrogenase complex
VKISSKVSSSDGGVAAPYRPQYEVVSEKIIEYIQQAGMKPGDRLPTEQGLGEQFGVSRNIVREAIKYLAATGLVAARKGVGVYVAGTPHLIASPAINLSMQVDPEHIQALFDFRCMQEMLTARIATAQITLVELRNLEKIVATNQRYAQAGDWDPFLASDDDFHRKIAEATHNPFFVETVSSIMQLQRWAIKVVTGGAPGSMVIAAQQHEVIFDAIKDGQPEAAAQAVKTHIETVLSSYRQEARRRLLNDEISNDGTPS